MGGVLGALICIYCKSGCSGTAVASALAFHPPIAYYDVVKDSNDGYSIIFSEEVQDSIASFQGFESLNTYVLTTTTNTKIPVIHISIPNAKYTILYSHGNATDIGAMMIIYAMMAVKLRVNIVAYDYTGYGPAWLVAQHGKRPTDKQVYRDVECVYKWCVDNKIVNNPKDELVLYGQSIGSGPTCYIASQPAKYPIAGIVLHSPLMSGTRVLTPSRILFLCDIFPNIDRINKVRCPVFIIHGVEDNEVHFFHGEKLFFKVPNEYKSDPWWVPKRGHNDILQGNEKEFFKRMKKFLDEISDRQIKGKTYQSAYMSSSAASSSGDDEAKTSIRQVGVEFTSSVN